MTRWICSSVVSSALSRLMPVPGEAEDLALAQAEHEDQDVRGVERIFVAACRFEELTRFLGGPRLPFAASGGLGSLASDATFLTTSSSVMAYDRAERSTLRRLADGVRRRGLVAAFADRTAPLRFWAGRLASLRWMQHWQKPADLG